MNTVATSSFSMIAITCTSQLYYYYRDWRVQFEHV